jgi:hypothetical protein
MVASCFRHSHIWPGGQGRTRLDGLGAQGHMEKVKIILETGSLIRYAFPLKKTGEHISESEERFV